MRPLLLAPLLLLACGPQAPTSPKPEADFSLSDVNPASERFEQQVSPRDYGGKVSAWYFGHST